uniref:Uncharacterized protein n=1 Tax=Anopheles maculatus TaxID=74869 RepID=A0A182SE45_9DIPT
MVNKGNTPSLMQIWIDRGKPETQPFDSDAAFVITPPIVRIDPKNGQSVRLMFTGEKLPQDRETLFWFNALEIPPASADQDKSSLQIAVRSRLKLFYRPAGLAGDAASAPNLVKWHIVPTAKGGEHYDPQGNECVDIKKWIPDSSIDFEQSKLKLNVSIPQAYMQQFDNNYIPPEKADSGVTAAFIDYNANAWRALTQGNIHTQYYLGINTGFNLANWRLRHNGYYNHAIGSMGDQRKYTAISSYLQRDSAVLRAQLTLGQYYTAPDLFDSVSYSGIQLASDERMLPDSQRGFAPTIRGTAESNAKVTIRQGGNVLYETSVSPGPFMIDKLYGSGYAGDMEVTVTEADGRKRTFVVPFATVPQLLRPSVARFNVVLGKYRDDRLNKTPEFFQGTYQRGISNLLTAYSGAIVSQDYQAMQVGLALSTTLGAFAVDATQSHAVIPALTTESSQQARGQSYRFTYSKLLETTQTNFTVASYRFSSRNYYSFSDYAQSAGRADNDMPPPSRQRSRVQANISQNLGEGFGSFYLSGSIQNYWNADQGRDMTYQL